LKVIDIFNLAGTLASLIGLIIVIYQIGQVKAISEATRDASEKTKARITSLLFVMDIPKALKIAQEVQFYNRNGKFELSILRMQDLKYHLIQIKNNAGFSEFIDKALYKDLIVDLSIEISSMEKGMKSKSKVLDSTKSNATLEKILTHLFDIDTTVKIEGGNND
jgi:hypothetical protein